MKRMLWALALAAPFVAGCQSTGFEMPSLGGGAKSAESEGAESDAPPGELLPEPGLAMSSEQRFKDIPLPVGLTEEPDMTFVYQSERLAVGRMAYSTRASMTELAQFFIDECPAADWKRTSVVQTDGVELEFSKPEKRLNIKIRDRGLRGRLLFITLLPTT